MSHTRHRQTLMELEAIDFTGRGEAYVEQAFITPLLECLGYEAHKDYEVRRRGDDDTSFKLRYPPVESGASRVKHYNPDYMPTIRKKVFWIIEAKSPKEANYPFSDGYIIQGLQYCVHPEIRAKYLLVTNGVNSAVYDAYGSVFLGKDMYEPVLEFKASELTAHWERLFSLLSVEKLRAWIEADLKAMYDKLCLSSLDATYPRRLIQIIGVSSSENSCQIEAHVRKLYLDSLDEIGKARHESLEQLSAEQAFQQMELPIITMDTEAGVFVRKSLSEKVPERQIFRKITQGFDSQSIFRKEQSYLALCFLYRETNDQDVKNLCSTFLERYADAELPPLTNVECAALRLIRKVFIVSLYPALRENIQDNLRSAPELVRFVRPPTALEMSFAAELAMHHNTISQLKNMSEEQLTKLLSTILRMEGDINDKFLAAKSQQPNSERQFGGFEVYGVGGKHWRFKGLLDEFSVGVEEASLKPI